MGSRANGPSTGSPELISGTDKEGKPFGGGWSGPQFVLTHRAPDTPVPGVTFVGDLNSGVAAAKVAAGEKYVNVLGANTAQQCLNAGVLDEITRVGSSCKGNLGGGLTEVALT